MSFTIFGNSSGAFLPFGLALLFARSLVQFPSAALCLNVTGSFLIGLLITILGEEYEISENVRFRIILGFLGIYTIFSTFEFEFFSFIQDKQVTTAILYVLLSFALGLISVLSGIWVGKKFQ